MGKIYFIADTKIGEESMTTAPLYVNTYDNSVFSYYKQYKVTNNVTNEAYTQWIEGFVRTVIHEAEIRCNEVVIDDIEESKRIFLLIDGKDYTIRTWSFRPYHADENNQTCAEVVPYTLYRMVDDEQGSHGEPIIDGESIIWWDNAE